MMKLFGTDGVRGVVNSEPMTVETVMRIGKAIAYIFKNHKKKSRFLIGKDTRLSGYIFETALSAGICSMGADVLLVGPLPTPGIAFVTADLRADAGAVISASHNPYQDNGIKFFTPDGYKIPDEIEQKIENLVFTRMIDKTNATSVNTGKAYRVADSAGRYMVFLKSVIPRGLKFNGFKVVLDCANGAAYKIAPALIEEIGAKVIPINVRPNGKNINRNCGALFPEEMAAMVKRTGADIGFSLDGDGDRLIIADEKGRILNGDHIIYMLASFMKRNKTLRRNTVVVTYMSNLGLEQALSKQGIRCLRTQVGDRFVVEEMEKNNLNLGGEQSGHIVFLDEHTTGDGLLTALKILWLLKVHDKPLSRLVEGLKTYPQIIENVRVTEKKSLNEMPEVLDVIKKAERELDGTGRVFTRYSGTENIFRIMIEGKDKRRIQRYTNEIKEIVKKRLGSKEETCRD